MAIFPIYRRLPILFGNIFCLFDSFITQDPRKMRGCLRFLTPFRFCGRPLSQWAGVRLALGVTVGEFDAAERTFLGGLHITVRRCL